MSIPKPSSSSTYFLGTENITLSARTAEAQYSTFTVSGSKLMPSEDLIEEGGNGTMVRYRRGTWVFWTPNLTSGLVIAGHPRPGDQVVQSGGTTWTLTDVKRRPFVGNYFCEAQYPYQS